MRIFKSEEDFNIAKEILLQKRINFTESSKPSHLPGSKKVIIYNVSDGVKINEILLKNGIETRCFRML
jgi:hypothetical protein